MSILSKIQHLLRSMDDDALASLSNRGLLRRAKKDLVGIKPEILEQTDTFVRIQVEDCVVTIPEIPAEARSTSPAGSIDRYVLIAFLWLRDQVESEPVVESNPVELPDSLLPESVDDAALIAWAGKALFRKTQQYLDGRYRCVVESESPLVFRVPERNITCRWLDGGRPETMIVTGTASNIVEDGLLALMLYQIEKGVRAATAASPDELDASSGAPRTRAEILVSLGSLLHEMVFLGLTRLSVTIDSRLRSLAVSAHGVELPRLEKMIQSLADEVQLQLSRNAQGSTFRILTILVQTDALRRALLKRLQGEPGPAGQTPLSDLIGVHRSRYLSVGNIELTGMGARQWKSRSGYAGLTVYFWDVANRAWATWSESRPTTTPGFDPAMVFHGEGPWKDCPGPAFASRNRIKLVDGYRNDNGRLSARSQTQAVPIEISKGISRVLPPPITDWKNVHQQAKILFQGGLAKKDERQEIVFLLPEQWGAPVFDPVEQSIYRPIMDTQGDSLTLTLSYDPEFGRPRAIRFLEEYRPTRPQGLLGLIRLHRGSLVIEPVSIFDADEISSLTLEEKSSQKRKGLPKSKARPKTPTGSNNDTETESEDEFEQNDFAPACDALSVLFETILSELETMAESGLGSFFVPEKIDLFEDHAKRLDSIALEVVSNEMRTFLDRLRALQRHVPEPENEQQELSDSFLRLCHTCFLAQKTIRHER